MKIEYGKLNFDDVYIKPRPSEIDSRKNVDLNVSYITLHSKRRFNGIPVILSNMDTVGQINIAKTVYNHGFWTCLHKFYNEKQLYYHFTSSNFDKSFITIGPTIDLDFIKDLPFKINAICIDAANAYLYKFLDFVKIIRDMFPDTILMAGNVCTPEGVENLIRAGTDIVKCGIANGEFCDTKNKAGIGYKQFSVALECGQAANELHALCCSDGGCKSPSDIAKAIAAGSHMVMIGSIFGGVSEANESEWIEKDGELYMKMYGMSSKFANEKYFGGLQEYRTSEGKEGFVKNKGSANDICLDIMGGLASCCTYSNISRIENLHKNAIFTV